MWMVGVLASLSLIGIVLVDSFETMVLPRRVTHRYRFARLYYRTGWTMWRTVAPRIPSRRWREAFLSLFGPLSLLGLLITWVLTLILGYALLHFSLDTIVEPSGHQAGFAAHLYWSGGTFFTMGFGDLTPITTLGRALTVLEAGMGFGFLGIIIGYIPVIYQAFSRRELTVSLLDARAGSPPSAAQFLLRLAESTDSAHLEAFLSEWERWSAELLESHISFPVLGFYRSQHDNQSWLSSLTLMLDACAILIVSAKDKNSFRAQLTFAMARHAAVDVAIMFKLSPPTPGEDRLPPHQLRRLRDELRQAGFDLDDGPEAEAKLTQLRQTYEPFVCALARFFLFSLPAIMPEKIAADNWQRSAWMAPAPNIGSLAQLSANEGEVD